MTNIQNKQTVSITNSSGVTVGNIENIIHDNQSSTNDKNEVAPNPTNIHVNTGGGSYVDGNVYAGGDFVGRDSQKSNLSDRSLHLLIGQKIIPLVVDTKSHVDNIDQQILIKSIYEIENELSKGNNANEFFIMEHLQNIQKIAPQILRILVEILINPPAGTTFVGKKILDKLGELNIK